MLDFTEDRLQSSRVLNHALSDCSVRDVRFADASYLAVNSTCGGVKLSDPGDFVKESSDNAFSSSGAVDSDSNAPLKRRGLSSENDLGDFSCDSEVICCNFSCFLCFHHFFSSTQMKLLLIL